MTLDPQFLILAVTTMAVGYTMTVAGLKKHALERKPRRRVCPSCGRNIDGRVCSAH